MDNGLDSHEVYLHIRVIISVVLGLGITRILSSIARLVEHPGRERLSAIHLLWVTVILITAIHFWWWQFALSRVGAWHFGLFLFVIGYAFVLYLLAALLFPDDLSDYDGFEDYFLSRRRWFFGLFAASFVFDWFDTWTKGPARMAALGTEYQAKLIVCLILCAVAAWTRDRRFHFAFALLYLVYDLSWIFRLYDQIG